MILKQFSNIYNVYLKGEIMAKVISISNQKGGVGKQLLPQRFHLGLNLKDIRYYA